MDINKLMQQAQAMQKQLEKANEQINILNPEDVEMIEDLVMIAVNDAIAKADNLKKERFGSMASAMGLPMK